MRGGDLGSLPVVVGLVLICASSTRRTRRSFVAQPGQHHPVARAVGTIAIGIVLVLLLGQIDLSVGSVSGLSAAILGVLVRQSGLAAFVGLLVGALARCAIGLVYGLLFTSSACPAS